MPSAAGHAVSARQNARSRHRKVRPLPSASTVVDLGSGILTRERISVEDWPTGYSRFTALIAAHPSFHISRRFTTLRARLLLLKQDRVSELEEKLERLDRDESRKLFLASTRRDANPARRQVLSEIGSALGDYGIIFTRTLFLAILSGLAQISRHRADRRVRR